MRDQQALWKRSTRRVLLNGPPLTGKTTACLTMPAPRHFVFVPGEGGLSSIQPSAGETRITSWEVDPTDPAVKWGAIWRDVQIAVDKLLALDDIQTLVIDSARPLYYLIQKACGYTADSDAREFGRYHELFTNFVTRITASRVPYVVMTCHDGPEPMEAGSKIMQIYPDLPGAMAKGVLKMFPLVIHTTRTAQPGQRFDKFEWELRPNGKIQGVGLHVPFHLLAKFPDRIPITISQDGQRVEGGWHVIEKILAEA